MGFDLRRFNITLPVDEDFDKEKFFCQNDEIYAKFHSPKYQRKCKILRFLKHYHQKIPSYKYLIYEPQPYFAPFETHLPFDDRAYFVGCWENIYHFAHIDEQIRAEFTLKEPMDDKNERLKEQILSTTNSVFLHIRLGDFPSERRTIGAIYYENAINYLKQRLGKCHIFVFSNEIHLAKREFLDSLSAKCKKGVEFSFMDKNDGFHAAWEMQLMRHCKHAICTNSTFSFWASYLIANAGKIVIMPSQFWAFDGHLPLHPLFLIFKGCVLINPKNGRIEREF